MNRISLFAIASLLATTPFAAKADTVINLNATTGSASTSYPTGVGNYNNLAPAFYSTITLSAGTYSVSVVGTGVKDSFGNTSVYSGWDEASTPTGPAPGRYEERTSINTSGGSFQQASAANGYQNSYTTGSTDQTFFSGLYASNAAALAAFAASPYTFTLASTTAVTFYIPDGSYNPNNAQFGFDDNSGGVSLDVKAVTPEPSSLLLLATGTLTAAGAIKRRIMVS